MYNLEGFNVTLILKSKFNQPIGEASINRKRTKDIEVNARQPMERMLTVLDRDNIADLTEKTRSDTQSFSLVKVLFLLVETTV